jgi:hypothetical protein
MAKVVKIELFVDLSIFSNTLADLIGQATSRGIVNTIKKRNKPRDTGNLMDSVRNERLSRTHYLVTTDLPYSKAQERGRPDLKNYTYTPYMEPGALSGTTGAKMNGYVMDAAVGAESRARI